MPNIALRSPQFKYIETPVSNFPLSVKCTISINGIVRYTLIRNNPKKGSTQNFDISELVRDYLDITYDSNYVPQTVVVQTIISKWTGLNATGTNNPLENETFDDIGFEAYGTYEEGTNPELPLSAYLISNNPSTSNDSVDIYYPKSITGVIGYTGKIPLSTSGVITVQNFGQSSTTIGGAYTSTISRIDCTKYGGGRKIIFINKFGVQQDLWFFLKETKTLGRQNEGYKSNTITYPTSNSPATYSISNAPNKVFNTTAKQTFTLSSGYYPEQANQFFEQLLLSEYVWLERPQKTNPSSNEVIPVKVKTSSMAFKTSVNDRLIEYTIDFEEAFDYINNIR